MNLLDIAIGAAIGGYFLHTENGRKEAMNGLNTAFNTVGKYAEYYLKDLVPKLPGIPEKNETVENINKSQKLVNNHAQHLPKQFMDTDIYE